MPSHCLWPCPPQTTMNPKTILLVMKWQRQLLTAQNPRSMSSPAILDEFDCYSLQATGCPKIQLQGRTNQVIEHITVSLEGEVSDSIPRLAFSYALILSCSRHRMKFDLVAPGSWTHQWTDQLRSGQPWSVQAACCRLGRQAVQFEAEMDEHSPQSSNK